VAVGAERDVLDTGRAGGIAIRGGALRTGGYFVAMLLSLASVPFMTRHLGPVDYGYYATVSSILFIITGITEAGLTNLGTREYVVLEGADRDRFLRNLVGLRLALTTAGVLFAVLFTAVTGAATLVVQGTLIMGAGVLLTLTQQTYAVPLSAQLRLGWVAGLELLKQATISATIVLLVVVGASLLPFFFATLAAGVVMLGCTLVLLRGEAALVPAFDLARWRKVLADVLPYALAAAVGLFYFRLAIILMSYIASGRETGIYGAAFRIVESRARRCRAAAIRRRAPFRRLAADRRMGVAVDGDRRVRRHQGGRRPVVYRCRPGTAHPGTVTHHSVSRGHMVVRAPVAEALSRATVGECGGRTGRGSAHGHPRTAPRSQGRRDSHSER
jgi:polysaccharide biosynthesis protein